MKYSLILSVMLFSTIVLGQERMWYYPKYESGKYGLVDGKGKLVLPLEYDFLKEIRLMLRTHQHFFLAKKEGIYGIINEEGEELIPFEYSNLNWSTKRLEEYFFHTEYFESERFGLFIYDYFDPDPGLQEMVEKRLADSSNYFHEYYRCLNDTSATIIMAKKEKWGAINGLNQQVIAFEYDTIQELGHNAYLVSKGEKMGILGLDNHVLVPLKLMQIIPIYTCNGHLEYAQRYFIIKEKGKYGIFDSYTKQGISARFDQIEKGLGRLDHPTLYGFWGDSTAYIYADTTVKMRKGNTVLQFKMGEKYGLIGLETMKVLTTDLYSSIEFTGRSSVMYLDGKATFLTNGDSTLHTAFYDEVEEIRTRRNSKMFQVRVGQKWGVIGGNGNVLIPIAYEGLAFIRSTATYVRKESIGHFVLENKGKKGLMDEYQNILIPVKYDSITWNNKENEYPKYHYLAYKGKRVKAFNEKGEEYEGE